LGLSFSFWLVFYKKKLTKPNFFFLKKKPNRTETGRFDPVSVFLGQKSVQTGLARFFQFWLGFFRFWLGFSGLARFGRFGSVFFPVFVGFVSVRFSFFSFLLIKPKPNRTGRFFQKFNRFNRFFFRFGFFGYFVSGFLGLIGFLVFLLTPTSQ
jgi:hypothetical protein